MEASSPRVLFERHGSVARIILNRPRQMNAADGELISQLLHAVRQAAGENALRVLVISGSGDHFMAGGDVAYFDHMLSSPEPRRTESMQRMSEEANQVVASLIAMNKPVIAAVRGHVVGFGFSLVCASDLAIAADNTRFRLGYGQLGVSPDGGATYTLPRIVGSRRALELALMGDEFDASRASALGLVNAVVAGEALDAMASAWAERLAAGSSLGQGLTKRLIHDSFDHPLAERLDAERDAFLAAARQPEFAVAVSAFLKRHRGAAA